MKKAYMFLVVAMVVLTAFSSAATAKIGDGEGFIEINRDRPRLMNMTDDYGIITVNIGFIKERVEAVKEKVEERVDKIYRPSDVPIDTPIDRAAKKVAEDTPVEEQYEERTGKESDPVASFVADHDTPLQRMFKKVIYRMFQPYGGN